MPADITAQARQSLENVKAIIQQAGLQVADIVKTTVFVKDLNDFVAVNAEYERFFKENNHPNFPARSCVEVARLPKDVGLEIEAIAVRHLERLAGYIQDAFDIHDGHDLARQLRLLDMRGAMKTGPSA